MSRKPAPMSRRNMLAGSLAAGLAIAPGFRAAQAAGELARPRTVVELFTSQGCSSCPPADQFLETLGTSADVVTLAYHVDYWDYLGWKDPFGSRWATELQYQYAAAMRSNRVATPQMLINGWHVVSGNNRDAVTRLIRESRGGNGAKVDFSVRRKADGGLLLDIRSGRDGRNLDVIVAKWLSPRSSSVRGGENGRRMLRNSFVSSTRTRMGAWDGTINVFELPSPGPIDPGGGLAVLLQEPGPGKIHGVATLQG